jgi:hypothetical protein
MSTHLAAGGEQENSDALPKNRPVALVQLIATAALAVSTLIAVTAVSIGIARADVFVARADSEGAPLAIALFIGLLLSGMGGLTAIMADDHRRQG